MHMSLAEIQLKIIGRWKHLGQIMVLNQAGKAYNENEKPNDDQHYNVKTRGNEFILRMGGNEYQIRNLDENELTIFGPLTERAAMHGAVIYKYLRLAK